jgi:hypothetical protein
MSITTSKINGNSLKSCFRLNKFKNQYTENKIKGIVRLNQSEITNFLDCKANRGISSSQEIVNLSKNGRFFNILKILYNYFFIQFHFRILGSNKQ